MRGRHVAPDLLTLRGAIHRACPHPNRVEPAAALDHLRRADFLERGGRALTHLGALGEKGQQEVEGSLAIRHDVRIDAVAFQGGCRSLQSGTGRRLRELLVDMKRACDCGFDRGGHLAAPGWISGSASRA